MAKMGLTLGQRSDCPRDAMTCGCPWLWL